MSPIFPGATRNIIAIHDDYPHMRALVVVSSLVVTLGLAVVTVWGVWQNKQADWWAAWGQWVGGVGSIAAAAVAIIIAYFSWRISDKQALEQLSNSTELARRTQASLFAVWLEETKPGVREARYLNASSVPVHDVNVFVQLAELTDRVIKSEERQVQEYYETIGPTAAPQVFKTLNSLINDTAADISGGPRYYDYEGVDENIEIPISESVDVLLKQIDAALEYDPNIAEVRLSLLSRAKISVSFRDNSGQSWIRNATGTLNKVPSDMTNEDAARLGLA
jgi:hypothetical protein